MIIGMIYAIFSPKTEDELYQRDLDILLKNRKAAAELKEMLERHLVELNKNKNK